MEVTSFHDPRIKLSYWYPQLPNSVPTPETTILSDTPLEKYSSEIGRELTPDQMREVVTPELVERVRNAVTDLPTDKAHIRTDWKSSLFGSDGGSVIQSLELEHVIEQLHHLRTSAIMNDFPVDTIIIREHLDLDPVYRTSYGSDLYPEVRFLVEEGSVLDGFVDIYPHDFIGASETKQEDVIGEVQTTLDADYNLLENHAKSVAETFSDSSWSVDFIQDASGEWYCTDMAIYGVYFSEDKNKWNNISHVPHSNPYNPIMNRADEFPENPKD
jgi:hypothetical protein